jgi:hypothetical protein
LPREHLNRWVCSPKEEAVDQAPDTGPVARAVGTLLAPVVACLRGDGEGYGVLVDGALSDGVVRSAVCAAPTVARVYLALAPPPGGPEQIVRTYADAAREHFEGDVVSLGAQCLAIAHAHQGVEASFTSVAVSVFTQLALEHGERHALEGAVASVWWAAFESARLRDVDPIEEAAAVCRYVARVA